MQNNNIENELLTSFIDTSVFDANALQKMESYGQKYPWFGLASILGAKAATETETDTILFSKTGIHSNKPIWLAAFLSKTIVTTLQQEVYEALPIPKNEVDEANNTATFESTTTPINQLLAIEHEAITAPNEITPTQETILTQPIPKEQTSETLNNILVVTEINATVDIEADNIQNIKSLQPETTIEIIESPIMPLEETQKASILPLEEPTNIEAEHGALANALALADEAEVELEIPLEQNQQVETATPIVAINEPLATPPPENVPLPTAVINTASIAQYDYEATESLVLPSLPTQGFNTISNLAAAGAAELKQQITSPTANKIAANEEALAVSDTQMPFVIKPGINAENQAFEPYHTVDYFAAVGIKIDDKLLKDDRIGQQLRSFNDWLKTMKNLHPEKLLDNSIHDGHGLVEIKTLDDEEVITEAMAIVYLKQGRKDKAVELLAKLSLLNSSKTAYFANLIQEFNNI